MNGRKLHYWLGWVVLLPLALSAVTGLLYRIGRAWFEMSRETGDKVLHLHTGGYFGSSIAAIYVLLLGIAALAIIVSGIRTFRKSGRRGVRSIHMTLALIFFLPLGLSAVTGMAYELGNSWFNISDGSAKVLLSLHQGSWLGPTWRPFYILLLGAGVLGMLLTGLKMLLKWR